jgi:hypothetical protein
MNHSVQLKPGRDGLALARWRERIALADPVIAFGRWLSAAAHVVDERRARPWLAMVAVPLAMNAAMLLSLWWTWAPLIVTVWWWAERGWPPTWFLVVEYTAIGTGWCIAGSSALAEFPSATVPIGAIWAATALALALTSLYMRRSEAALSGNGSGY